MKRIEWKYLKTNYRNMSYDPGLPADFDPIAMWVEDPVEEHEDDAFLDDDSDDYPLDEE